MRIRIYAEDSIAAAQLAAKMNLSLRHWHYAGKDWRGIEWADVGKVMDHLEDVEDGLKRRLYE